MPSDTTAAWGYSGRRLTSIFAGGLCALALAVSGCGGDDGASADTRPTVVFASTDVQGLEELQRDFDDFVTQLEARADLEVEFHPVPDRTVAAEALRTEQVDLVLTGPAEYVALASRAKGAEPVIGIEIAGYSSCVLAREGGDVQALTDLEGEQVAFTEVGSTSGHLGPAAMLSEAGVDPVTMIEPVFVGGDEQQFAALKRGDVAAVGTSCNSVREVAKQFPERLEGFEVEGMKVIAEGGPLPPDVIMAGAHVPEETVAAIEDAFEGSAGQEIIDSIASGDDPNKYSGEGRPAPRVLNEIEDGLYDPMRAAYEAIDVDPASFEG